MRYGNVLFWSPDLSERDHCFQWRPCIRVCVCPDKWAITVHQFFSEILQQVVFSYLVVHCKKIFGKNLVASPGPQKGSKNPKNAPNWPKSHFSSIHQILMKFCQNVETIFMNINVLLLNPEKLCFVSLGDF